MTVRLWGFNKNIFSYVYFYYSLPIITFPVIKIKPEFRKEDLRWHSGACHLLLIKCKICFQSHMREKKKNLNL